MININNTIALFVINSIVYTCDAQNYIPFRNNLNEAEYWFYQEKWDSAAVYYGKAETFGYKFFPKDAHLYSRVLWETNNRKKSIDVLLNWGVHYLFKNDTTYYRGMSEENREKILLEIAPDTIMIPTNKIFFDTLIKYDQLYRKQFNNILKEDSIQRALLKTKMDFQDSINRERFLEYIKEYGFPGGYYYPNPDVTAIILHIPPDWLFRNYVLFLKEIKGGRMDPYHFGIILDRAFYDNSCKTQTLYNLYVSSNTVVSTSPEIIFINRCLIGLSPYFDNPNNSILKRGQTLRKTIFYDYYNEKKEDFNCSRFE
ncbi:MAG: hypothetical protein M9916_05000 [Crocinitomicaceae bacterium]|nr:hypothetical protein [Crocinitomicaceae bacterium]